jgi:hypothetical protein
MEATVSMSEPIGGANLKIGFTSILLSQGGAYGFC